MSTKTKENLTVVSQEEIGKDIFSLWLQTDQMAQYARPGQFLSLYTGNAGKLLPRPISICEIDKETSRIRLVYRVTGKNTGTEAFSKMQSGDKIEALGPLGNGFPLEEAEGKKVFLIGGGIGIPPMLETAKQLNAQKTAVLGYRDELFLNEEFAKYADVYVATEDGSVRNKGQCAECNSGKSTGSRYDLCLRPDSDASCTEGICGSKSYYLLDFHGRKNGMRNRCLSGMCLQIKRYRCTFSGT